MPFPATNRLVSFSKNFQEKKQLQGRLRLRSCLLSRTLELQFLCFKNKMVFMLSKNLCFNRCSMEVFHLFLSISCLVCLVLSSGTLKAVAFTGTYGVNYGRVANNLPPPESVVTLLRAAKIKNVRIYDADHSILRAFKGSGIELIVTVPNELLIDMGMNEDVAMQWVKSNVQPFLPDTQIRGIAIGNEILAVEAIEVQEYLVPAVKNIYNAIDKLELTKTIEITTPHSQAVFQNSFPPSACTFKESVMPFMGPLLQFFSQIGSPFLINAYPFLAYKFDPQNIDINYALFKPNPGVYDAKTKIHYDNMFDAQIDAVYAALEAAGFERMEVRVSETGWASHGDEDEAGATVQNARTYNFNLKKKLAMRKGTPLRPKAAVQVYVFALFNENQKFGKGTERNFGLFKPDGSIAYDIGFKGLSSADASSSLLSLKGIGVGGLLRSYIMVVLACTTLVFATLLL